MREITFDTETTGLDPRSGHKIVEIGCVEMVNRLRTGRVFHAYINPQREMPFEAFKVHGIAGEFLQDKPVFAEVADEFIEFVSGAVLVAHNASFDINFLNYELESTGRQIIDRDTVIDSLAIARKRYPGAKASLDALCKRFKIDLSKRDKHGALLDADLLAEVYIAMVGGSQGSFVFGFEDGSRQQGEVSNKMRKSEIKRVYKEARKFSVSKKEQQKHKEFIANNIPDNIWYYG